METLICTRCDREWEREKAKGRKPKLCPDCKEGKPIPPPPVVLENLPPASRTSGWCTDYDPVPLAQHDKCDGDLGKYRCPCECHGV